MTLKISKPNEWAERTVTLNGATLGTVFPASRGVYTAKPPIGPGAYRPTIKDAAEWLLAHHRTVTRDV